MTMAGRAEQRFGDYMKIKLTKKDSHLRIKYRYGAGLDIHKATVVAAVCVQRTNTTEKIAVQQFRRTPKGLGEMCKFLSKYLLLTIVMESTGVYTPQVKKTLDKFRHWSNITPEIFVINPSLLRKYPGETHADRVDAIELAQLGILGLAQHSFLPPKKLKELRRVTRQIFYVMKDSTRAKNRIKQNLDFWGLSLPRLDLNSQWALELIRALISPKSKGNLGKAYQALQLGKIETKTIVKTALKRRLADYSPYFSLSMPRSAIKTIEMYMASLALQEGMLGVVGNEIEVLLNEEPTFQEPVHRLTALPGVDEKTAAVLISEIGDISRFPTQKQFLQYVGCAPTIYQSGTINRASHLNKRVNHFAKRAFFNIGKVICSLVKQDSDLKEYGRKQLNRHWGNKKQAWVKTGIKAARIVHHMLKSGDEYNPFYESQKEPQSLSPSSAVSNSNSPIKLKVLRKRTRRYLRYVERMTNQASQAYRDEIYNILRTLWIEGG